MTRKIGFALCMLAALVALSVVSCSKADELHRERVSILTERQKYSPALSSTVGIGLVPGYSGAEIRECCVYHWQVDFGYFVAWNPPDFKVEILGSYVINTGEKLYWSYDPLYAGVDKPSARISLEVKDKRNQHILGETYVELGWEERDTAVIAGK